jgi:hypothetical protein
MGLNGFDWPGADEGKGNFAGGDGGGAVGSTLHRWLLYV